MKRNPKATCETCPFSSPIQPPSVAVECRKRSPRYLYDIDPGNDWAPMNKGDWCGEHPDFWIKDETDESGRNQTAD